MKRDLNKAICGMDGQPILGKENPDGGKDPMTLGAVLEMALAATLESDQRMPLPDKVKLFKLARRVNDGGTMELDASEIELLKKRVGDAFSNLIFVGLICEVLEADPVLSLVNSQGEANGSAS